LFIITVLLCPENSPQTPCCIGFNFKPGNQQFFLNSKSYYKKLEADFFSVKLMGLLHML
jgi:hypothetical protein